MVTKVLFLFICLFDVCTIDNISCFHCKMFAFRCLSTTDTGNAWILNMYTQNYTCTNFDTFWIECETFSTKQMLTQHIHTFIYGSYIGLVFTHHNSRAHCYCSPRKISSVCTSRFKWHAVFTPVHAGHIQLVVLCVKFPHLLPVIIQSLLL